MFIITEHLICVLSAPVRRMTYLFGVRRVRVDSFDILSDRSCLCNIEISETPLLVWVSRYCTVIMTWLWCQKTMLVVCCVRYLRNVDVAHWKRNEMHVPLLTPSATRAKYRLLGPHRNKALYTKATLPHQVIKHSTVCVRDSWLMRMRVSWTLLARIVSSYVMPTALRGRDWHSPVGHLPWRYYQSHDW